MPSSIVNSTTSGSSSASNSSSSNKSSSSNSSNSNSASQKNNNLVTVATTGNEKFVGPNNCDASKYIFVFEPDPIPLGPILDGVVDYFENEQLRQFLIKQGHLQNNSSMTSQQLFELYLRYNSPMSDGHAAGISYSSPDLIDWSLYPTAQIRELFLIGYQKGAVFRDAIQILAITLAIANMDPKNKNNTDNQGAGKYLDAPATKNGTLNIGAGSKPIEGAYNIDLNPKVSGVHAGNATNLSDIATGSQSKIVIENPYGYDPLNSEIMRVLQKGGTIEITGSMSNPYVNKIPTTAAQLGLDVATVKVPNVGQFTNSNGVPLTGTEYFIKFILQLK